mmetsp:Transcript_11901/g.35115  ORF Transcript_11901/g.35115 Transcript_11901/m.35115 type:complete len:242 (+) Transcript_11901:834-1559(+)
MLRVETSCAVTKSLSSSYTSMPLWLCTNTNASTKPAMPCSTQYIAAADASGRPAKTAATRPAWCTDTSATSSARRARGIGNVSMCAVDCCSQLAYATVSTGHSSQCWMRMRPREPGGTWRASASSHAMSGMVSMSGSTHTLVSESRRLGVAWWRLCLFFHQCALPPMPSASTTMPIRLLCALLRKTCRWHRSWPSQPDCATHMPSNTVAAHHAAPCAAAAPLISSQMPPAAMATSSASLRA